MTAPINVIVTRHAGLVAYLKNMGITGEVISHVESPEQIYGKIVYGVLPLHLAAVAFAVVNIDLPNLTPEQRGKDISPEEMTAAGATPNVYKVCRASGATLEDKISSIWELSWDISCR